MAVFSFLNMTAGSRAGDNFPLDPQTETRIGRGTDCGIMLTDPLCSRVHAVVYRAADGWRMRDADSRNGTYVNEQKIDEARLAPDHMVRVGSTQFKYCESGSAPPPHVLGAISATHTIIRNEFVGEEKHAPSLIEIADSRPGQDFFLLYQLSMRLLTSEDPDDSMRMALELLREWTRATVAGFLWIGDDGRLKPKIMVPESARNAPLSPTLTEYVCRQGQAVWMADERPSDSTESLKHFADALCVPLVHGGKTLGALHVYLESGRFKQTDFDFAVRVAKIAVMALVRVRRESRLGAEYQRLVAKSTDHGELIGESRPMLELKSKISRLARATGCVLIRGESGSGKELIARALHRASPRSDRPMLGVNCAAIPIELMESQLFGHKAGAFTGANRDHVGYFQQADSGTLFLDEVGELTLEGQAKLLRILEGHPFLPVGATREITVDVRVIAATNQDLRDYVRNKKFREDLYYRLAVFEISAPPLRRRGDDVGLLLDYFLVKFREQQGRPHLAFSPAARDRLLAYSWPGNVRQLRNVIDSAVVLAEGNEIEPHDLGLGDPFGSPTPSGEFESLKIDDWERRLITQALRRAEGNVLEAARLLGIGRATLYRKIEQFGIARSHREPGDERPNTE